MFPRLPARATFVADTNFVSGTQKMFLILFRNILCPQQMFPRNIMSNNVSATLCPRLPGPLVLHCASLLRAIFASSARAHGRVHAQNVKPRPNDRNMPTQHVATLLGATRCVRLATVLRHVATCWVLLAQV